MSKPETRFKENTGERFLADGRVRCHGLAKSKIRKWREAYEDYDTPTEELWPECQCGRSAEEGQFVCYFHGGKTPRTKNPPRTLLDVMPLDMAEKYKAVMESPDYLSRKDDINLLRTRVMMLVDELNEEANSEEVWGLVHEARVKLKHGDSIQALEYLEKAITTTENKERVWQELLKTEKLLGDMTSTQVKTAKDLQSMATVEQVRALISSLINLINSGAVDYIPDPVQRSSFTRMIVNEAQKIMGETPQKMLANG